MSIKGWYGLIRVGRYTDCHGTNVEFSRQQLQGIVDSYDPKTFEAALTIGHPTGQKDFAYGVVEAVQLSGDTLFFKPARLVKEFAQAVNEGKLFRVSAGLERIGNAFKLNHVAFLGAAEPAVPGLGRVEGLEFSAPQENVVSIDLAHCSEWVGKVEFAANTESWLAARIRTIAGLLRRLRDAEIERSGLEAADRLYSSWELDYLGEELPAEQAVSQIGLSQTTVTPAVGGTMTIEEQLAAEKTRADAADAKIVDLSAQIATLTSENTTLKTEGETMKAAARRVEFAAFCETQIAAGKMLPAEKESTIETMLVLESHGATVELAAGQKSRLQIYQDNLTARPKLVEFAHVATEQGAGSASDDPNTIALAARKYQDEQAVAGVFIDTVAAVKHVMNK